MEPTDSCLAVAKEIRTLHTIKQLIRDEQGAELAEYGLLVSLIALVALAGAGTLGRHVSSLYPKLIGAHSRGSAFHF